MAKFRILYVDTEAFWRGGQEQLFSLMVGMKERGHEVGLAARCDAPLALRSADRGIEAFAFSLKSEVGPLGYLKLLRVMRCRDFQIVHFNTPRCIIVGTLAARRAGIPVRVASRRVIFPLRTKFSRLKYDRMLDATIAVCESIRHTLMQAGVRDDRIHVVHEGVELDQIDRRRPPGLFADRKGLLVGLVAHLSSEKGHQTLLEAAARLASGFPDTRYALVGEGPEKGELVRRTRQLGLEKQVVFVGFRPDSEALTKEFDVFCLPSLSEGFSSALLCAMASGLPVVATRVGGNTEMIVDGETGFLVAPEDPGGLSEALAALLASKELRRRMGAAGRERVRKHFTLQHKLDGTELLYGALLERTRPVPVTTPDAVTRGIGR